MWCTSHQFFQEIFEQYGALSSLTLKVYEYVVCAHQSLFSVEIAKDSANLCLDANPARGGQKKRSDNLPFGMKVPKRKRARRTCPPTNATEKKKKLDVCPETQDAVRDAFPGFQDEDSGGSDSEVQSPTSSSPSSASSSTSESSDTEGEPLSIDPQHRQEEDTTRQILRSHADLKPDDSAAASSLATVAAPVNPGKTKCQSSVGLCDVGQQIAPRLAQCRHCGSKISRYSMRLAYSFSTSKFFAWIHPSCFVAYLQSVNGSRAQAVSFLNDWAEAHPDCTPEIRAELQELVSRLLAAPD